MAFGAGSIEDTVIGNAPPVRHADIILDRVVDLGLAECARKTRGLLGWKRPVDAGAPDIDPAPDPVGIAVRTVVGVGGKSAAMEAGGRHDAIGIMRGRIDGARATHAIADSGDRPVMAGFGQRREKRTRIGDRHGLGRAADHADDFSLRRLVGERSAGIVWPVRREAIQRIGHKNRVAEAGDPLCHLVERRPQPECVHVDDHSALGGRPVDGEKARIRGPVRRFDFQLALRHADCLPDYARVTLPVTSCKPFRYRLAAEVRSIPIRRDAPSASGHRCA